MEELPECGDLPCLFYRDTFLDIGMITKGPLILSTKAPYAQIPASPLNLNCIFRRTQVSVIRIRSMGTGSR